MHPSPAPARRPLVRLVAGVLAFLACAPLVPPTARAATSIVFNRDIKPVLSEHCFACHGPDPGTRKAGLRLDTREGLFESTPKRGPAVVTGKPQESELWKRLVTTDPDELMPPAKSHKVLAPAQKDLIRDWIAAGAPWQPHWAFIAPVRPPVPSPSRHAAAVRNPIDAFILARLEARGLNPAPEADRRTLARRLALDLTGLPPAPGEVEAFEADPAPDADARYIRRLMDSPAWGEHRARFWLDAARYADTHGLHFDNFREMWPYRDWVIRAFNRNLPFDEFTVEQIAGDLLPDPTDDQWIATGFHRCNATTNEGGTIEEENQVNYANDRVTTTGWVWLGLTVNCASCHDHKFDPVTMRDFYSLAAFFRNTTQSGFDGNLKDGANASMTVIDQPQDRARWKALPPLIDTAKARVAAARQAAGDPFARWAAALTPSDVERELARGLVLEVPVREGSGETVAGQSRGEPRTFRAEGAIRWSDKDQGHAGPALHFEKDSSVELGEAGDFDLGQPFSAGAWVYVPPSYNESAPLLARMDEAADHRGWDLWIQQGQFATHLVHKWPDNALKVRTRKRLARKGEWQHVFFTFDGSGKPEGVRIYVDGAAAETDTETGPRVRDSFRTRTPLRLGRRSAGPSFVGGALQEVRIYERVLGGPEVRALARFEDVRQLLGTPFAEWKKEARDEVFDYFLLGHEPFQGARKALGALEEEKEGLRLRYPVTHVQREKTNSPPMAAVLARGQYDKPKDRVLAGTPAVLHPFPAGAPTNRLGLARWLVARDNPLTARVTVNRLWQEVFGVGLVKTSEDFGVMGEAPVHPELLDWLAVEFVESGWDVKHLFRLMVNSATYRQSAAITPDKLEQDPANRLLSRGPRFRMDAEMVRDLALASSRLLEPRVGGASVKPYQPDGVWEAVAMPESNTRKYERDRGSALYRRSLYTFWKRSAPPALMDLFNAPSRESCTVRRERTNTPLQALATLNDPQFIEAARALADLALDLDQGGSRPEVAFQDIARRVLARGLHPDELAEVGATYAELERYYRAQPSEAEKLLQVGDSRLARASSPRLAALTLVANQILNLDEAITK